jgi:Domain of unknown function (DUF4349)
MSQRDLTAELRAARLAAPADLRVRVRAIAAQAPAPRRVFTWRRALVVALPAAAAIAAAIVVTRPAEHQSATSTTVLEAAVQQKAAIGTPATAHGYDSASGGAARSLAPLSTPGRVQRYNASLSLRLHDAGDVSDSVKTVQRITASLGGFPVSIVAGTHGPEASADIVVKVPRSHVQEAIRRFSALGTIIGEDVHVQDLEAGLNATDRTIAKLQRELRAATDPAAIAALTARIQRLQQGEAATRRTAHYATVSLHMETPPHTPASHHRSPWHGLVVGLRWAGIGAVYALVFGAPLVVLALLWRLVRRRREDALLSRS